MSRVAVIGVGQVGLVTATFPVHLCYDVSCGDSVPDKAAMLSRGEIPQTEADLEGFG